MARPLKQGNLDGLCGVYAVINAINSLLPDTKDCSMNELFAICINKLDNRTNLAKTILHGMSIHMIKEMLNDCKKFINEYTNYQLEYEFLTNNRRRINAVINDIKNDLNYSNTAVLVGVAGPGFRHWTTITKNFDDKIKFHDSDGLGKISISELTSGKRTASKEYNIQPDEIISIWINMKE